MPPSHTDAANTIHEITVSGINHTIKIEQTIGVSLEQFTSLLKAQEEHFAKLLAGLSSQSSADRALITQLLADTRHDLANAEAAYERQQETLEKTLADLDDVRDRTGQSLLDQVESAANSTLVEGLLQQALDQQAEVTASLALRLANLATKRADREAAYRYASRAVEADPKNGVAHFELGTAAFRMGKIEEAEDHLRQAVCRPDVGPNRILVERGYPALINDYWQLDLANVLLMAHKDEAAREILSAYHSQPEFLKRSPAFLAQFRLLAPRVGLDDPTAAEKEKSQGTDATPDQGLRAVALNNEGQRIQEQGDPRAAIELYRAAIRLVSPDERDTLGIFHINLASAYDDLGDEGEAESIWQTAKSYLGEAHPYILGSRFSAGKTALDRGDLHAAIRRLGSALELAEQHRGTFSTEANNTRQLLGQAYHAAGDFAAALRCVKKTLAGAEARQIEGLSPADVDNLRSDICQLEEHARRRASSDASHPSRDPPPEPPAAPGLLGRIKRFWSGGRR